MFYLMKMGVLYNRLSTSLIMLRVFGKELFDSIKHYLIIPKTKMLGINFLIACLF